MIPTMLSLLVAILIAGILVWAINAMPVIDATFKRFAVIIICVVVAVYVVLALARLFGVATP